MNLNFTLIIQMINCLISVLVVRRFVAGPAIERVLERILLKKEISVQIEQKEKESSALNTEIKDIGQKLLNQTNNQVQTLRQKCCDDFLKQWSNLPANYSKKTNSTILVDEKEANAVLENILNSQTKTRTEK